MSIYAKCGFCGESVPNPEMMQHLESHAKPVNV